MNRKIDVVFAGVFGTAAVLSLFVAKKYFRKRNYNRDYNDHHLLFDHSNIRYYAERGDGVELEAFM